MQDGGILKNIMDITNLSFDISCLTLDSPYIHYTSILDLYSRISLPLIMCNKHSWFIPAYLVYLQQGRGGMKHHNLQILSFYSITDLVLLSPLFNIRELDIFHVNCFVRTNPSFPNNINPQPLFEWLTLWSPVSYKGQGSLTN